MGSGPELGKPVCGKASNQRPKPARSDGTMRSRANSCVAMKQLSVSHHESGHASPLIAHLDTCYVQKRKQGKGHKVWKGGAICKEQRLFQNTCKPGAEIPSIFHSVPPP
eukprot:363973-Chlamydomonas_euryale.AAC.10